jgi:hypothetical protein
MLGQHSTHLHHRELALHDFPVEYVKVPDEFRSADISELEVGLLEYSCSGAFS